MSITDSTREELRERVEGALRDHHPEEYDIDGIVSDLIDASIATGKPRPITGAGWLVGMSAFVAIARKHALTTPGLLVEKTKDGWKIRSFADLTDEDAGRIKFRAEPKKVTLGGYVEVVDSKGIRTGHVATAIYREGRVGLMSQPYVICEIELS